MRELYQKIKKFYLLNEALSKEPSSPLRNDNKNDIENNLIRYSYSTDNANDMIRSHTGKTHNITWNNVTPAEQLSGKEKKDSLHDVLHAHNYFIKHKTSVGDVLKNTPLNNNTKSGVRKTENKRETLYKKAAKFGDAHDDGNQYGIVKQHPDDHPEEHMRGQKYLHPVSQKEVDLYQNSREHRNSSPEERMEELKYKTKKFITNLKQQKQDQITKLQPKKLQQGEDHLSTAQYTRNSAHSVVGKGLNGNTVNDEKNDRMSKLSHAIGNSDSNRRYAGRITTAELRSKTGFDKNHLEMAQRIRNMKKSTIGQEMHPISLIL